MNFYKENPALKFQLSHPLMHKIVDLKEQGYADKDKYDYAPQDFEDAIDSYDRILEIVGEICGEIIAPNAEDVDHEGPQVINNRVKYARGTQENHDALAKAGLYGMSLPRQYGGLNFSMVPYVMAAELVSRADAGFANISEDTKDFSGVNIYAAFWTSTAEDSANPERALYRYLICGTPDVLSNYGYTGSFAANVRCVKKK